MERALRQALRIKQSKSGTSVAKDLSRESREALMQEVDDFIGQEAKWQLAGAGLPVLGVGATDPADQQKLLKASLKQMRADMIKAFGKIG